MIGQRTFRVGRLWILPSTVPLVLLGGLYELDMSTVVVGGAVSGLMTGLGLGMMRARTSISRVDVAARKVITRPTMWLMIILGIAFVLKIIMRYGLGNESPAWHSFVLCLVSSSIVGQHWRLYHAYKTAARGSGGPLPRDDWAAG
jgi:hypothetical protein